MGPSTPNGPLCVGESPGSGGHHTYISRAEPRGQPVSNALLPGLSPA